MAKNYKSWSVGDRVQIQFSHSDDKGKFGTIIEVRPSFCKIQIDNEYLPNNKPLIKNHTYGQFKRV